MAAVGCSPRVVSNIGTRLEPRPADEPVDVAEVGAPEPLGATFLGSVNVTDTGVSMGCNFVQVVDLAKVEVRKAGGNYLALRNHLKPTLFGSSCHQIWGSIYYLDRARQDSLAAIEPIPMRLDLAAMMNTEPSAAGSTSNRGMSVPKVEDPAKVNNSHSIYIEAARKMKLSPWRFALDATWSCRISKIADNMSNGTMTDTQWKDLNEGLRNGVTLGMSATRFLKDNINGIGGKFTWSRYSHSDYGLKFGVDMFYFGPEYLIRIPSKNGKGVWICALSAGYANYRERTSDGSVSLNYNKGGFKSTVDMGYDFRLADGIFLGLKISVTEGTVRIPMPDGSKMKNSLNTLEMGGGLRF